MDKVSVSVVIPAFNSEDFIREAIQSVHAQTLPVAEVIVVDDGSSDRTATLSANQGALVLRQPHRGISAARNAGIRAAKSEWIAFLDADDIWMPQKIECQWAAISRHPDVGLVTCDLLQWQHGLENHLNLAGDRDKESKTGDPISYVPRPEGAFLADRMNYNSPTMLIRRELLFAAGLFDERVHYVEGVECYLRIIARCPIALVERPLVKERLHDRNTSLNYLDMSLAWIRMVDAIYAQPQKYPPGAAQAFSRDLSSALIPLGRALLDDGRRQEARMLLGRSLKEKYSQRAMMLWGLSFLRPRLFNHLLAIKHRLRSMIGLTAGGGGDAAVLK